jgi:hypothetical protein
VKRLVSLCALVFSSLFFITGCGGSSSTVPNLPNVSVSITQSATTIQAGGTVQLTALVTNDPTNKGVNWTVSCPTAPLAVIVGETVPHDVPTTYTAPSIMTPGFAVTFNRNFGGQFVRVDLGDEYCRRQYID